MLSASAHGSEVDNFTHRYSKIQDSTAVLNKLVDERLDKALSKANKKGSCDKDRLIKKVKKQFARPLVSKFESLIKKSDEIDKRKAKGDHVYKDFGHFRLNPTILKLPTVKSPLIRVVGLPIGADKFSHFFTEGFNYLKKENEHGIERALTYGDNMESGLWGKVFTGIFSYADLAANLSGLQFFKDLTDGEEPFFLCEDGRWKRAKNMDWSLYIDESWDEGINCSNFRHERLEKKFNSRIKALEEKNKKNYTCPIEPQVCEQLVLKYGEFSERVLSPECRGK